MIKKTHFLLIGFFTLNLNAQVGINTTSPTNTLDVNGGIRARTLPMLASNSQLIGADNNGNLGISPFFQLTDVKRIVANKPVDHVVQPSTALPLNSIVINDNIDLEMTTSVLIPAGKQGVIIVNYSIPIGIGFSTPSTLVGTYGVRFLKNNTEAPEGSRKTTIQTNSGSRMVSLSNIYIENIPLSTTDQTIEYTLNGYIEQGNFTNPSSITTYRFNMWSNTGSNFNWGHGSMSVQVFLK